MPEPELKPAAVKRQVLIIEVVWVDDGQGDDWQTALTHHVISERNCVVRVAAGEIEELTPKG